MAGFLVHFEFRTAQNGGAAAPDCFLRPERFQVVQSRSPSIIPLPQQNAENRGLAGLGGTGFPVNLTLDFGLMQEQISLSGKIPDEDRTDLGVQQNISGFMSKFRTHWVESPSAITQNDSASNVGLIRVSCKLQETDGQETVWYCSPMTSAFARAGGNPWWEYDIKLGVVFYPPIPAGF